MYLIDEVVGALVFGRLSDQLGRRELFTWTLAIYLAGTGLTALTPRGSGWVIYLFATRLIGGTAPCWPSAPGCLPRGAGRGGPDLRLDRHLLLRLGWGERLLPVAFGIDAEGKPLE